MLVAIPILALIGLYAFAAATTASAAISLARTRTVKNVTGLPTGTLEAQIDAERLLAVVYLAAPVPQNQAALTAQEQKTDRAQSVLRSAVTSPATMASESPQEKQAVTAILKDVAGLQAVRSEVASLAISRPRAIAAYGGIITAADNVLNQLIVEQTNIPLVSQGLAFVNMGKAEEILLQEDALLTGDMLARSFSAADRQEFAELVGARRAIYAQTLPDLDPVYRSYYASDVDPRAAAALTAFENAVIRDPRPRGEPPVSPTSWAQAVGAVSQGFSKAGTQAANELTRRAQPAARSTFLRLFVVGGLGLLAVLLSIIMSIWIGRGLLRQLAGLRQSALELANERLPSVMQRLRAGQDVDVSAEAPPLEPLQSAGDEFGQVRQAFNAVQRTAIEAAVDEARLRRGISDVFRNLARRSQSLLHRQLALLDGMERRASGPEELEDLFRIDHLTTRMRRHAEGLIILSGESPGRGWRHPVPLVDVLRAAVAEVEDYTRIRVVSRTQAALAGPAVADVIHLIAELAENATIFSPPNTPVRILGDTVGRGFAVEIEDRGLGITAGQLAEINSNLENPPQFDLSGSDRLGLFIAGQLARRHDIKITLRASAYGGTTAIVLIPSALVIDGDGDGDGEEASITAARERAIRLTGRHAALSQGGDFDPPRPQDSATPATAAGMPTDWRPADVVPADWQPAAGMPTDWQPAAGMPTDWQPADVVPADWQPAAGVPTDWLPTTGVPTDWPAAVGTPEDGQPATGGPTDWLPARLPADRQPADRQPATGGPTDWLPAVGLPAVGLPADQQLAAGGPTDWRAARLPADQQSAGERPAAAASWPPEDGPGAGRAEVPASPFAFPSEPAPQDWVPPATGNGVTAADPVPPSLPRRIRQASLAPQLRDSVPQAAMGGGPAPDPPEGPSPEAARNTMMALQQGWERGRSAAGTPAPEGMMDPEPVTGELALDRNDE